MKKSFRLLSAALIALASFVSAQAATITLFDSTDQSPYCPVYTYNNDNEGHATQTILPASEIQALTGATINSMKFYVAGSNGMTSGKLAVSVGTTEMNSFYQTLITDGLTKVAEISPVNGETEILVNFDQPWAYTGGNMVIEFKVVEEGNYTTVNFYGKTMTGAANAIYGQWTKYTTGFYPKTTFDFVPVENMATVSTTALDFGQLYPDQDADPQTFTIKNVGMNAFTPVFSGVSAPYSVTPAPAEIASGESVEYNVTFAPTALGEYNQTLAIDCGAAGQFEIALTGAQVEVPAEIVVAEGTATSNTVPIETGDYDYTGGNNQSQMIYNADLLGALVGKKINGFKFHASAPFEKLNGGKVQLSMKVVEQSTFESNTPITDLTVVATGSPVIGESEIVFTFDEPFEYNGGNLVVEALVVEAGDYSFRDKFLGVTTNDYVSYAHFNSSGWETHRYKFLPMATFSYVKEDTPEPQGLRGDVNGDEKVDIDDATMLINYLLGEPLEINQDNANCDGEEGIDIGDATALINFLLNSTWDN